jgi:SAM-dependent methyltransferase
VDARIVDYYDRLAPSYDANRFGNSYGQFLDLQERSLLERLLPAGPGAVLDIGCGTGRLSNYASHCCDASIESLRIAMTRHPGRFVTAADIAALPFPDAHFDVAFCFHVFMHLTREELQAALAEIGRILRPGGVFVGDVASAFRRSLLRRRITGWHGATSLTRTEFGRLAASAGLHLTDAVGVMLTPVHRLPLSLRPRMIKLDRALAARVPDLSSYIVGRFVRQ